MLIDKFAFQSVEVTLHRSVVVRTPGTAHALGYIVVRAVVGEFLRGVLGTLVAVKYHAVFQHPWVLTYSCFKRFFPRSAVIFLPCTLAITLRSYKSRIVQLYLILPFDRGM